MFCPKCGTQVADDKNFCPHCGADLTSYKKPPTDGSAGGQAGGAGNAGSYQVPPTQQRETPQVQYVVQQAPAKPPVEDSGSFGWAVLGFFIPLVGFILWLVWKDEKPQSAKMSGIGALVGILFSLIVNLASGGCVAAMIAASL